MIQEEISEKISFQFIDFFSQDDFNSISFFQGSNFSSVFFVTEIAEFLNQSKVADFNSWKDAIT